MYRECETVQEGKRKRANENKAEVTLPGTGANIYTV